MKKMILSVVIVVIGLTTGCRLSCTPYDCCGPIYSNPHNCDPNYRSGSAFNAESSAPVVTTEAPAVQEAPTTPAAPTTTVAPVTSTTQMPASSEPVTTPTTMPEVPTEEVVAPIEPTPTLSPAPLPSAEIPAM